MHKVNDFEINTPRRRNNTHIICESLFKRSSAQLIYTRVHDYMSTIYVLPLYIIYTYRRYVVFHMNNNLMIQARNGDCRGCKKFGEIMFLLTYLLKNIIYNILFLFIYIYCTKIVHVFIFTKIHH